MTRYSFKERSFSNFSGVIEAVDLLVGCLVWGWESGRWKTVGGGNRSHPQFLVLILVSITVLGCQG